MILKIKEDAYQRRKAFKSHEITYFLYSTSDKIGQNLMTHVVRENIENKLKGSYLARGFIDVF
jgi:hypothetical protein